MLAINVGVIVMGKYTIIMGCGHEDTVTLFGSSSERKNKIEYFKEFGLCKECYKTKMIEQEKAKGLVLSISAIPDIDKNDGSILFYMWFSGDTISNKERIKSIGYSWGENEYDDNEYPNMSWSKTVKEYDLQDEISKAESIGAKRTEEIHNEFYYKIALKQQKKWKESMERIMSIPKPKVPSILIGHRWNQKVYGKTGNYSIYLDGEKVNVTDEKAKELKDYIVSKEEYNVKVEEIKNEKKS